jgi:hypothetical protein
MCTGDKSMKLTAGLAWCSAKINIIIHTYLFAPVRPLLSQFTCIFCGMIVNVLILFSLQNVTLFYVHFNIFKLKLDLQYRYARAQLTVRGRGAECRNSSRKVGVTSLKIREYSETAVERNTFLCRNELNHQKVWPTLLESFVTNLLTFERDVVGATLYSHQTLDGTQAQLLCNDVQKP